MNLLSYKNRFTSESFTTGLACERNGYVKCLDDILSFLKEKTQFNPNNRMIDTMELLEAITDTNKALIENSKEHSMAIHFNIINGGTPQKDADDLKGINI